MADTITIESANKRPGGDASTSINGTFYVRNDGSPCPFKIVVDRLAARAAYGTSCWGVIWYNGRRIGFIDIVTERIETLGFYYTNPDEFIFHHGSKLSVEVYTPGASGTPTLVEVKSAAVDRNKGIEHKTDYSLFQHQLRSVSGNSINYRDVTKQYMEGNYRNKTDTGIYVPVSVGDNNRVKEVMQLYKYGVPGRIFDTVILEDTNAVYAYMNAMTEAGTVQDMFCIKKTDSTLYGCIGFDNIFNNHAPGNLTETNITDVFPPYSILNSAGDKYLLGLNGSLTLV